MEFSSQDRYRKQVTSSSLKHLVKQAHTNIAPNSPESCCLWTLRTQKQNYTFCSPSLFYSLQNLTTEPKQSYTYLLSNGVPGKATTSNSSPFSFTNCPFGFGQTCSPSFPQHLQLSALAVDNFGVIFPFRSQKLSTTIIQRIIIVLKCCNNILKQHWSVLCLLLPP